MGSWADFLVKRRISDDLLAFIRQEITLTNAEHAALTAHYQLPQDLKTLRAAAETIKPRLSSDLRAELGDQLREISEDLLYAQTDIGKTVLTINDWLEPWYKTTIRGDAAFDDVMIGSDADTPFKALVTGQVPSPSDLEHLREIIEDHAPPFEVTYKITLATDQ